MTKDKLKNRISMSLKEWWTYQLQEMPSLDFTGGIRMTDEEKAKEWVDWYGGASLSVKKALEEAYLAGLKAGRPKWHAPSEKLPEEGSIVLAVDNLEDDSEPSTYEFVCSGQWEWLPRKIAVLSNDQIKKWCEIPKE